MSDVIEQVAKFLWECDQEGTTDEWREMAWSDMGGSEPTPERQIYELRARALADAGLLARLHPEPDWLDAPAVLASMNGHPWQKVCLPRSGGKWTCTCCGAILHWSAMADVTPLYPKEDAEPRKSDTPHDAPRWQYSHVRYDKPWGTRLGGDPA